MSPCGVTRFQSFNAVYVYLKLMRMYLRFVTIIYTVLLNLILKNQDIEFYNQRYGKLQVC